jgi:hypothetical protein
MVAALVAQPLLAVRLVTRNRKLKQNPLAHGLNIRPAFVAMRDIGFPHLRVLILPHDFNTDWISKGHLVKKAK